MALPGSTVAVDLLDPTEPDDAEGTGPVRRGRRAAVRAAPVAVAVVVALGVAFRLVTTSDLWLDEALSVDIARLPLDQLFDALRRDGHPPLYYLLLHWWMAVFGEGDLAVRSLSALFSLACLPLVGVLGRRHAGRAGSVAALVLLASSPYAIRYATEARMYALLMLGVLVGWLALEAALTYPTRGRLGAVAAISGLLLLTHYWAFYLVASVVAVLLVQAWRCRAPERRRVLVFVLAAVAAGGLLFLPWLPSFVAQARATGTPWGSPSTPAEAVSDFLGEYGGGTFGEARLLGMLYLALAALGLFGRAVDGRRVELDLRTRPRVRVEAAVLGLTLALGIAAAWITGSAIEARYTAVVFPVLVVLAAVGVSVLASPWARGLALGAVVALAAVGAGYNALTERTQGGEIGRAVSAGTERGDVVAFCPDQLGPGAARALPEGVDA
ncbi:MAG: glycosyltransferase family 39 protein, partial [Actinomycetota bacterium]|nr:glycosyltransferase family 39 protein [Actinomycetota bacterium]